jgi:putative lipoprotein
MQTGATMAGSWTRGVWVAMLLATSPAANAGFDCNTSHGGFRLQTSDAWFGADKAEHFGVSLPFGSIGAYLARDSEHPVIYGTLIGSVPGLIKEGIDGTCRSDGFSYKDLTADVVGAFMGAVLAGWAITYERNNAHSRTIGIAYTTRF